MAEYEYRWGPGHGEWIPFEELLQILNAWNSVGPGMGYPAVTISKRVKNPGMGYPAVTISERVKNPECNWIPGDAIPSCDFDPFCPVHGKPTR